MMKKPALLLFFAVLIVFPYTVYADGPYLNIPPTNAYSQINTTNGTVTAPNFISSVKLQGLGSTVITADNATQTIYISSGHITPVGDRFGWFAVNTSPNLQNQHFYNFSTGPGITATVSADDFILSAINFVNATSKICGAGQAVTAFDNSTGTFTCSPFIQTINGNSSANHFITGTLGHIKVTDTGSTHNLDILFKINNATCSSGRFSSYDNKTGNFVCSGGSGQTLDTISNIGTGQASIYAGNTTNTHFNFKTLKQGQGISLVNNTNDVTISTNFKVNSKICGANAVVTEYDNSTGIFTCTAIASSFVCNTSNNCVNLNTTQTIWQPKIFNNETQIGFTKLFEDGTGILDITTNNTSPSPFTAIKLIPRPGQFNPSSNIYLAGDDSFDTILQLQASNSTLDPGIIKWTDTIHNQPLAIGATNNSLACSLVGSLCSKISLSSTANEIGFNAGQLKNIAKPTVSTSAGRADSLQLHSLVKGDCANNGILTYRSVNGTWICGTVTNSTGTVNTFQNIGHGGQGVLSAISSSSLQSKNITSGTAITVSSNATDVIITNSGVTSVNALTGALTIAGTTGNITASAAGSTITINTAYNVVTTGLSAQTFTKNLDFGSSTTDKFANAGIIIRNPTSTFATTLAGGAQTINRTINLPVTSQTDTLAALAVKNNFTKVQNMSGAGQINGLSISRTQEKTSTFSATKTDDTILMNVTGGSRTVTLPTSNSTMAGKLYFIKQVGLSAGNVVMVNPQSGQTIDGFTQINMTHNGSILIVQSNGTAWNRINEDNFDVSNFVIRGSTAQWYGSGITAGGTGTVLNTASKIFAIPWIVANEIIIDKIQIEVSTAANPTSTTCRMGIYRDSGNVYPTALVTGSDVGTFTTALGVKTNTFSTPITLKPGLYYFANACATAGTTQPTFRAWSTASIPSVLGSVSTMGGSNSGVQYDASFTFGALPTTFPAGGAIDSANTRSPAQIIVEVTKG